MRVNRWWPDHACVLEVAEIGGELSAHRRRHVLRSAAGVLPRALEARTPLHEARPSAVPGPVARSEGWEVRAHDDLLYFLQSGRPRFVMSQAMAPAAYSVITSRLSGGDAAADAVERSAAPAREPRPLDVGAPVQMETWRGARSRGVFTTVRALPRRSAVLAASFVVLALALIAAMVAGPRWIGRAELGARRPAAPPASVGAPQPVAPPVSVEARRPMTPQSTVGARAGAQTAGQGQVAGGVALHPAAVTVFAPARVARAVRVPRAISAVRRIPVRPAPQYVVVSGSLPRAVAVRRVLALVASGLEQVPQVMRLSATRARVYYGEFNSRAEAQALATRVRTLGYTAAVVTE
jgi:DedD protein